MFFFWLVPCNKFSLDSVAGACVCSSLRNIFLEPWILMMLWFGWTTVTSLSSLAL